ncbi:protein LTO1 homolog [Anopheles bellator]|uniref:protein LTO1 homolog n=1 Tax=Anopheles bellator TaxID=139047 RepID=UPI0026488447|nr:protein LTO1 homolog [Anopheles bellator]
MSGLESISHDNDDINDVFEDIFLTEERVIVKSYHQGLEDGRQQEAVAEAFDYGHKKGSEIGREIGFYQTIVTELASQQVAASNERALTLVKEIEVAVEKFPRGNDPNVDLLHNLQQIRNKYRRLCALLKLPYKYEQGHDLTF